MEVADRRTDIFCNGNQDTIHQILFEFLTLSQPIFSKEAKNVKEKAKLYKHYTNSKLNDKKIELHQYFCFISEKQS